MRKCKIVLVVVWDEKSYTEFINKGKRSDNGKAGAHTPIWREEGMKKRCSNKGFSLVELIIVIAIMAILIGVMAPQLIKYIEKAKVANDTQILDTLHSAITYALMDPEVQTADDKSKDWIADFTNGDDGYGGVNRINFGTGYVTGDWLTCKFVDEVTENMGFNPWTTPIAEWGFESTPDPTFGFLAPIAVPNDSGTAFMIYLQHSDRTGHKEGETYTGGYAGVEDTKVIYVK